MLIKKGRCDRFVNCVIPIAVDLTHDFSIIMCSFVFFFLRRLFSFDFFVRSSGGVRATLVMNCSKSGAKVAHKKWKSSRLRLSGGFGGRFEELFNWSDWNWNGMDGPFMKLTAVSIKTIANTREIVKWEMRIIYSSIDGCCVIDINCCFQLKILILIILNVIGFMSSKAYYEIFT